ncbi:homogentisate 1,2-dioxygenase [Legionella spiritensis]|uniref:Homogentisate 1,2-dioxygenase n=1 Tax=Legionella spiritensis TaxID=452 RepID=A0A0W0Z8P0_LEGSP|nr:homogentisate 1,2-dioxygenase [Legionella spiritensis]KTD65463.1 Homogentisate 1,2-dioxygenase [Legionella spiritensis]SNV35775.1 Homogentisate 1,2-dioxygenase [Legionella spiritensis]
MYLAGFGNHHQTEAIPGSLPENQNSPQQCPFGLYAEQLSGSAFTRPRHLNLKSWLYRTAPSVVHQDYKPFRTTTLVDYDVLQAPNPYRWSPLPPPENPVDFVDGLFHVAGNRGNNAYIYQCNVSMNRRFFSNSDGEMLIVPYLGELLLFTEFGKLAVAPGKIAVIPRGVVFMVELISPLACGYICENMGSPLTLPQLGPVGANGLANPRHFQYPCAAYVTNREEVELLCKYQQNLWTAQSHHSPLNVVAWQGNYAPYSYDLALFNTINTVSFDHPDPSIFTVLTSESETPGVANLDFVIFPPRWMVAENTFRPPYFHRNIMSELMGLITGEYDAKQQGFLPGGVSIHNCMTAHGPDKDTYQQATTADLKPAKYENTLAFMFETREPWLINKRAISHPARQLDYSSCWQDLAIDFNQ